MTMTNWPVAMTMINKIIYFRLYDNDQLAFGEGDRQNDFNFMTMPKCTPAF